MFSDRADERMQLAAHEPGRRRSAKRPDGVYGLAMTLSFAHYVNRGGRLKYSPFSDGNPLYPFLIIEAKSEKSEDGFVSVEQQSAASLKECLDLQLQLTNETGVPLSPLVWFVGYRGDEWRLYAAVPHSGKIVSRSLGWWTWLTNGKEGHRPLAWECAFPRRSAAIVPHC